MVQKKSHEVDAWVAHPDPRIRIVLIYGPDRGLVSERAQLLAIKTGIPLEDPFCVARLDAGQIEQTPGRLLDEARTLSMFANERLIWLRGAGSQKELAESIRLLVADPPARALILVEAGELKKTALLRTLVEAGSQSIALPCYPDDGRGLDILIDNELGEARLTITSEARQALKRLLGGDRLASRGELMKLALFCRGLRQIGIDDVKASIGDVAALSPDDAIEAVLIGNTGALDEAFSRIAGSGATPSMLLGAILRQFQALQLMRQAMDSGSRGAAAIVAAARPPIFFSRRKSVELALQRWTAPAITQALDRLQTAMYHARRRPELLGSLARQTLVALAAESARYGREMGGHQSGGSGR